MNTYDNRPYARATGIIVLIRYDSGTLGTRSVPWADVDGCGVEGLNQAVALVAAVLQGDAQVIGASLGNGYKMREVNLVTKLAVGLFLEYPL